MREKWNLDVNFHKDSDIKEPDLHKRDIGRFKEFVRRDISEMPHELKKTKEEEAIIHKVNEAMARFLKAYELPLLTISTDSVHIIKSDAPREASAWHNHGNIFLSRSPDKNLFISRLTHEVTHELSYVKMNVNLELQGNTSEMDLSQQNSGLNISTKTKAVGVGFNEAMTEMIADVLRSKYAEVAKLGPKQTEELTAGLAYYPQILVIEGVLKKLKPEDPDQVFDSFVNTYITGDKKIYKIINDKFRERNISNGLKILMSMGPDPENALETTKQLGLREAQEEIEDLIDANRNIIK